MNTADSFYNSKAWKAKRKSILVRDKYRCRECARFGKRRDATIVHHANPIQDRWDLRLHSLNLVSLCNKCHEKMHDRTSDKLTGAGEYWKEKCDKLMRN